MHDRSPDSRASPWLEVALLDAATTIFRLWAMSRADLIPDEAYYWLWSRAPSAGYYDPPPMIAWWIWLSTHILGDTALGVRILPVLSVFVASMAVCGTVMELYADTKLARMAALWLNAMLLIGLEAVFATPDAPSGMFWALAIWALALLLRSGNPALRIVTGALAGAGCVGKYTNLFLGSGIVLWLILDPKAARWRFSPWVLAGGATALAVFLPVLIWNAENGWISFAKQFGRIGNRHFYLGSLAELVVGQFGMMNPIIAVFCFLAVVRFCRQSEERAVDPLLFLFALTFPIIAYLIFHTFHDRVHANWPAPTYSMIAIAAAFAASQRSTAIT